MELYLQKNLLALVLLLIWVLPWKGYSMWTAAKRSEKSWFVILLILNTFAILDIFYIFFIAKKSFKDIKSDGKNFLKIFSFTYKTKKEEKSAEEKKAE